MALLIRIFDIKIVDAQKQFKINIIDFTSSGMAN